MKKDKKKLFIIDAMGQVYRSHFAMIKNPLITSKGVHTSVIYGFLNMLIKLIKEQSPEYLVIAMDSRAPTFRHEIYPEYKANREKMPDEIQSQLKPLKDIINYLGIKMIEEPGFEADDIIGSLSSIKNDDVITYIVTNDKDMFQLVNDYTAVYSPGNRFKPLKIYSRDDVKSKMGVFPESIIDLLSLMGDSSDNIPGVRGVGPKTAIGLLKEFGSLENIIENVDKIRNDRIGKLISNDMEMLKLSNTLVKIKTDMDIDPLDEHYSFVEIKDQDSLRKSLVSLEMPTLLEKFVNLGFLEDTIKDNIIERKYHLISKGKQLADLFRNLAKASIISFDLETTSIHPMKAEIVGVSFSIKEFEGYYIPLLFPNNLDSTIIPDFDRAIVLENMKKIFSRNDICFCGQNIKYDILILKRNGIEVKGNLFDTMIAESLIHPNRSSYKLDILALDYLKYQMIPIEDLIGKKGKDQKLMSEVELDIISYYACEDSDVAFQLYFILCKDLSKKQLDTIYYDIEIPTLSVLVDMEYSGVYIDASFLQNLSTDVGKKLNTVSDEIYSLAGITFNLNSPKQLSEVLFDKLGIKEIKKRSTSVEVLTALKNHHPIANTILLYRQLSKLKNTYLDAIPNHINPITGRVHCSFNQTIAATGRLTCNRPNLQNIPIRTDLGREIRKGFVFQDSNHQIFSADYSQIELRVMAHFSKEEQLVDAFNNDKDIHTRTAATVFKIKEDQVSFEQRRMAKVVNFSIMYGAGPYRLSQELNLPIKESKDLIDSYFATYPRIKEFIENLITDAETKGYVKTLFGRKRNTFGLKSSNQNIVNAEKRASVNMPIQGTAAELIKVAMIRINKRIIKEKLKSKIILQIHDELLFEVPNEELKVLQDLVIYEMENAVILDVPLKVDYKYGNNWYEAH